MTIKCKRCGHTEYLGAYFCSECGFNLDSNEQSINEHEVKKGKDENGLIATRNSENVSAQSIGNNHTALLIVETNEIVYLEEKKEYTIGRVSEDQPILPDIDLSASKAYANGVSRIHALVKLNNNNLMIKDLDSSNGTRINSKKIYPKVEYQLNKGDTITLGKQKLKVI